jgi:hypothetical protein
VNKWGLQAFLYQSPVQTLVQALFVDLQWGVATRCARQHVETHALLLYVAAQITCTYTVAWLMHEEGIVGRYVHWLWHQASSFIVALLEARPFSPRRPGPPATRYA